MTLRSITSWWSRPETRDALIRYGEESVIIEYSDDHDRQFIHESPAEALCLVDAVIIDRSSISGWLAERITDLLPDNVTDTSIVLRQEDDQGSFYHYSHGLKKHDGNCQRIAHGHRSRIEIWENGERSRTREQRWADKWEDIYLGTRADLVNTGEQDRYRFEYRAAQGRFMLELPASCVYLIDDDSTVECIARHIARHIADEADDGRPKSSIGVKTWEGVRKGAIAEAGGQVQEQ